MEGHTPELLFDNTALYTGWESYYRAVQAGADAWSDEPPLFVKPMLSLHLTAGASVADFGCGDGRNTLFLAQAGHRVTAVDLSLTALERLGQRFDAMGWPSPPVVTVLGQLEDLPLGSHQFEGALCIDALPQVRFPRHALQEMHRTLKAGAVLIVNLFTLRDCAFGQGEPVGPRSFLYHNTLFNFFEHEDFVPLYRGLFEEVGREHVHWDDPPHHPFRPYPHRHDALVYALKCL